MLDHHYENERLASLYDLDSPWSPDREFYLSLAKLPQMDILDMGCGTGLICDAYAKHGHHVVGTDPAPAMLNIAKKKPHGDKIEWVCAGAQDFQSEKRFDLIIMTGHAFQVLLDDDDVIKSFEVMRGHLKPEGVIVFESRKPAIDWAAHWDYDMSLETAEGVVHEARRFLTMRDGSMTFELRYQFPDEELVSESKLRFWSKGEIEAHLTRAGLHIHRLLGDWDGSDFDEKISEEMIFVAGLAV